MSDRLALCRKPDAERVIELARRRGVYDDGRRVREHDAETVAVPVTASLDGVPVLDTVPDADPERRRRGLSDLLRARGLSAAEIERAPASWAVVGALVLADFGDCERRATVGEALLELHGEAHTVLDRCGIAGEHREPDVRVVAGRGDTETVHVEHGTAYALDLADVMFSPGNEAERVRTGRAVASGETVLDMFAGVGYFTLPVARAGASVLAVERNPAAFRHLVENTRRNGVADRVRPVLADCRDVVARRDVAADRVLMGHYDAESYVDAALSALAPGGTVHLHATTPAADPFARPVARLRATAGDRAVTVRDRRVVKSYSPGVDHVVVEASVSGR
ncbi:MAG: class I SAM-dependent methyltransferase family protein [Halobacteriaceae archaeon]